MKKIKRMTCGLLPLLAGAAVLIEHYTVPNAQAVSGTLPVFIGILMCGVLILTLLSIQSSSVLNWLRDRSAWYTAIFLIFLVLDVLTQKTGIFGPPMFPSPDRLLAELVLDRSILLDCAGNSLKLLFTGYFWGMLIGLLTGIPAGRPEKRDIGLHRFFACLRQFHPLHGWHCFLCSPKICFKAVLQWSRILYGILLRPESCVGFCR